MAPYRLIDRLCVRVAVSLACTLLASGAAAECRPPADPAQAQYIVGYGSLMQAQSRGQTSPSAGPARPIQLQGYRRGWFSPGRGPGFGATYLGVIPDREASLNAVIYEVDAAELTALAGQAWIYVVPPDRIGAASADRPIVQSYVDVFLSGCFEQEERFSLAGFARECVATTRAWSAHWINDRLYPRRAFVFQPRARQIDQLLAFELPQYFTRIRLEGAR